MKYIILIIILVSQLMAEDIPIIQPSNHTKYKNDLPVCSVIIPHEGMIALGHRCCWNELMDMKSCVERSASFDAKFTAQPIESIEKKWNDEKKKELIAKANADSILDAQTFKYMVEDSLAAMKERAAKIKRMKRAKWSNKIINQILKGEIRIGMNKAQVIESWGEPYKINRTVTRYYIREQWIFEIGDYYTRTYVYFENGIMTSFQD